MVVKKKAVKKGFFEKLGDKLLALIPAKHSQKMHTLEVMTGVIIVALPALTKEFSVSDAGWIMLGFTLLRAYLVSIKQS